MIGKLTGIVDFIAEDAVILDVGGVGYLVLCPASTLSRLTVGAHASLMIEMKVSDDAIKLYGFASAEEREWFRLLQTVQNVGGKVALAVLSTLSPARLAAGAGPGRQGDDRTRPRRRTQTGAAHRHRIERQGAGDDGGRATPSPMLPLRAARKAMRYRRWCIWAMPMPRRRKRWRGRCRRWANRPKPAP